MIYFDNSATTPVCPEAVTAATRAMTVGFGNPGAVHKNGIEAKLIVDEARASVASLTGASPEEIYFSHSGTLANNTAVFGSVEAKKKQGNRIITSLIEHPSVARCMDELESKGYEVIRLAPAQDGRVSVTDLADAMNDKTILVSIMSVNNETGAINDIKKLCSKAKQINPGVIFHTDAIQAAGKLPIKASALGVDLLTMSGHKLNAPKGVGALFIRKDLKIHNYVFGGGQENGFFSGTEPVPAIAGFGAAVKALGQPAMHIEKVAEVRDFLVSEIKNIPMCAINSPENALPYILNISALGIPSQVLINYMSARGIYISAGSACKKGHRSEVLTNLGLPPQFIDSAIRISLSRFSTCEEAAMFVAALKDARNEIRTKL